ncbi:MAG TPA: VWA domain-containing protein [Bryobacteraceae bacterium]
MNLLALDRKGAPVTDLTKADFEIFDEARPQPITSFRANGDGATQSVILIVFDLLNVIPSQRAFTFASIVHALEPLEESDSIYLYILTNHGSLYPVHALPLTRPTLLLHKNAEEKVERVASKSAPWTRQIDLLMKQALEKVVQLRPTEYRDVGMEAGTTFRALATLGAQLTGLDGDKSIIWITRGTPNMVSYPHGCRDFEFGGESGTYLAGKCRDSCPGFASGRKCVDYAPFLEHFSAELERSGTSFSSVEETGSELSTAMRGSRADTLRQLANLTSGRKYSSGDIKRAIADAMEGARGRYHLTYQASEPDRKYHSIRVVCRRKGVRIQAPQGYFAEQR